MAPDFSKDTVTHILDYMPTLPPDMLNRKKLWILFPAFAYRVLAPNPDPKRLNPFQRAVLHFMKIGVTTPSEMAEALCLDPELIKIVIADLEGQGRISNGKLIDKAGSVSEDGPATAAEIQPAYVFQNVWTGQLLPRVKPELKYARVTDDDKLTIDRGSHGNRRPVTPLVIRASVIDPQQPQVVDILNAVHQHQEDSDNYDSQSSAGIVDVSRLSSLPLNIDRVEYISDVPALSYLLVLLTDHEDLLENEWQAADPFGLGNAAWIYQAVSDARNRNQRLDAKLKETFESRDLNKREITVQAFIAEENLTNMISRDVRREAYFTRLVQFEGRYEKLASQDKKRASEKEDVVIQLAKIVEHVLQGLLEIAANRKDAEYPDNHRSFRKKYLDQCAGLLGLSLPLPEYYANISPQKVNKAKDTCRGTIAELLIANLVVAFKDRSHPLVTIAAQMPDLFKRLAHLAQDRNQSAHATDHEIAWSDIASFRLYVYEFLEYLITAKGLAHVEA
jgi:hypothetical protein